MKKFTKEGLLNTYIENDFGKLRELYINACISAGFENHRGGETINWYNLSFVGTCWSDWRIGQTRDISGKLEHNRELTLADFEEEEEPKMETKYKYTLVDMSPEEIYRAMLDGEVFYENGGTIEFDGIQFLRTLSNGGRQAILGIENDNQICCREEIKWQDEVLSYLRKDSVDGFEIELPTAITLSFDDDFYLTDSEFLEMCRVALRATGELK
jgi:hypothetical protein